MGYLPHFPKNLSRKRYYWYKACLHAEDVQGSNPLTGLRLLQLYPLLRNVLDGVLRGGVCEKDEVWNMHTAYRGHFAGFGPMFMGMRAMR